MARKRRILFLCTANCCRSQMAEAILKHLASDRFVALSAGSQPAGYVHPLVHQALDHMGISVEDQHSKSWEEFVGQPIDLLVTVCDSAAEEVCPVWPNGPPTVHWPLPDPVMVMGTDEDRLIAAHRIAERLMLKLRRLADLDWEHDDDELRQQLERIGDL
jgi:arsenate reductase